MKIQSKFLYLTLILTVGVMAIGLGAQLLFQNRYRQKIVAELRNTAYFLSRSIDEEILTIEKMSFRICTDKAIQQQLSAYRSADSDIVRLKIKQALSDLLFAYAFEKAYISSMRLALSPNDSLTVGKDTAPVPADQLAKAIDTAAVAEGSGRLIDAGRGIGVFSSVRAIREITPLSFAVLGTLIIDLDIAVCVERIVEQAPSPVRFSIRSGPTTFFSNTYDIPAIGPKVGAETEEGFYATVLDGEPNYVVTYRNETRNWVYSIYVPAAEFNRELADVGTIMIVFFALLSCLFIFVIITMLRGIIRPITSFTEIMQDFESHHFEIQPRRLPVYGSCDEIDLFIRVFKSMAEEIKFLINDNLKKKIKLQEAEYKALQAQINPHFLYNTFDSINWLAQIKGEREISAMVVALSGLLRSSIADPKKLLRLEEEAELVDKYVLIQKIRLQERLEYSLRMDAGLEGVLIPRLTLQPLIENSINVCLENMNEVCRIDVHAMAEGGRAVVSVVDNGPGIAESRIADILSPPAADGTHGLALANINERLKILFGQDYGLEIMKGRTEGAEIRILIPLAAHRPEDETEC